MALFYLMTREGGKGGVGEGGKVRNPSRGRLGEGGSLGCPLRRLEPILQGQIRELYRQAQDAGESVPTDAYDWARSDLQKMGDWEYMLLRLDGADDEAMQARLNELGADRWEVFWMQPVDSGFRVFLKRPARSYLRHVPLSELSRIVPGGSSE